MHDESINDKNTDRRTPANDTPDTDETRIVEVETDEVDEATGRRTVRSSKSVSRTVRSSDHDGDAARPVRDRAERERDRAERHRRRAEKRARRAARAAAVAGDTVVERGDHRRGGRSADRDRRRDDRRRRRVGWDDAAELERHQRDLEQRVADLTAEIFHIRDRLNQLNKA